MIGEDGWPAEMGSLRSREAKADNLERVLLVDDDPDLLNGLAHLLGERYDVLTACNGAEALHVLEHETVDVVVLDVLMPLIDGHSVLRELRAKTRPPPVVVVSARPDLIAKSMEIGADDFLSKPFGIAQLERKIEALVERGDRSVRSRG